MAGVSLVSSGDWKKTEAWLNRLATGDYLSSLESFGRIGVDALMKETPTDSGLTAKSWGYRVIDDRSFPGVEWFNTNVNNGVNIAIIIQYGHGTGTGGYVVGRDYINPAIQPVFDKIADEIWKEVSRR